MTNSVSLLFGSEAKVKIMRLFVFNPDSVLTAAVIAKRIRSTPETTRRELRKLVSSGLIKRRIKGYALNPAYPYLLALENFLIDAIPVTKPDIIKKLSPVGAIKLILISGIFLHDHDSRVDIMIVGDRLKNSKLLSAISSLEAEFGRELRYASFETADFQYRHGMYDKLIRDILDSKHEKVLNKLGI